MGPGHLVVPLLIIGLIVLVASRRQGRWCGPGPGWNRGPDGRYRQRWHDAMASPPGTAPTPPTAQLEARPGTGPASGPVAPNPTATATTEREPAPPEP